MAAAMVVLPTPPDPQVTTMVVRESASIGARFSGGLVVGAERADIR
jgi:hypothetical protein